ncbi:hypothetical protein FQZ97_440960 [compost metagenome]
MLAVALQRQESQRAVVGEALPGGTLVRLGATHAGDDGVVQVIPLAGRAAGQAAYRGVGAVGGHHQGRAQLATAHQGQQPVVAGAPQALQTGAGQQADAALVQRLHQGVLDHAVLDDVAEHLGVHAGGGEMDLAGAGAVPDPHLAIGAAAPRADAGPGAEAFEDALAGGGQGADPRFEGRCRVERLDAERAAVDQQDVQAAVLQRQGQGTADHAGAHDDQIRAQFHIRP